MTTREMLAWMGFVAVGILLAFILLLGAFQLFEIGPYSADDFYTCDDLRPRGC